ncbi:hypothetical protein GDO86_002851 [Hymenochirus boettgeri]|uniref:Secreted protein n=1 Tax=Hymenochirus boettgeri TaxID=247094 RepID=A0A8T2K734_9PIPI|nr:hypothetical protein GDO86_002851 [Hymenochirus boettgeri]
MINVDCSLTLIDLLILQTIPLCSAQTMRRKQRYLTIKVGFLARTTFLLFYTTKYCYQKISASAYKVPDCMLLSIKRYLNPKILKSKCFHSLGYPPPTLTIKK